ncbi:TraG-like protein [Campylobacter hyointestinalis subsp. hyointestinalis]|uniref:TraG-like protein n=2 Tax=Campylobacter hyointestinalis TaxID=198 RepID=A0A0S4SWK8_CAMHY|nr:TraG-like protein [Campylobacter hyointestinalis subsp. hyointestinalis]
MIKKILLLITILACPIFAADVGFLDVIWVWGDGELLAKMISTMYVILNEPTFVGPIGKTCACIAAFSILFSLMAKQASGIEYAAKITFYMLLTVFLWKGFLEVEQKPINRVYLLNMNEAAGGKWATCTPVNRDNNCYLPWATKYIMTAATTAERAFVAVIEKASVSTNAQTYSFKSMGYGYSFDIYQAADRQLPPSWATKTYNAFWDNCVIYEINSGRKTLDDIIRSKDLSVDILTPNSARLTTIYTKDKPKGYLSSCSEVDLWHLTGNETCQTIASNAPNSANKDKDQLCVGYQNFAQLMLNTAKDADSIIKQQIMIKMTNRAIRSSMIVSGLDPNAMAGGLVTADREQRTKWASMGLMAKEWLPTIRDIMQSFAPVFALFGAFGAILVGNIRPIGMFVGFVATLIVWSVCLEFINIATYHYLSLSIPNMFGFDIGRDEIRTTMLTSNYINDEFQKAASFMGYMAIAAYAIAQGVVSMASGKIGAAFAGSVSGLGLSSFAVRSAAQGKIETPMSNVGPDGVTNWNALRSDKEVINSYGGFARTAIDDRGNEVTTTNYGGSNGLDFKSVSGAKMSINGDNVSSFSMEALGINATNGINQRLSNTQSEAIKRTETAKETLARSNQTLESIVQEGIQNKSFGLSNTGSSEQVISDSRTGEKGSSVTGSRTQQNTTNTGFNANVGAEASAGIKIFGTGATTKGSINASHSGEHSDADTMKADKTDSLKYAQTQLDSFKQSDSYNTAEGKAYAERLQNAIIQTQQDQKAYEEALTKEQSISKLVEDTKTNGFNAQYDVLREMAQDAYNQGGIDVAKDFLDSTKNYEKFSANLQAYLDKKYGGGLDEANAKFDKESANANKQLFDGKNAANTRTNLGTGDKVNNLENEIPVVETTVSPTVTTDQEKINKGLNDHLTNNGGVVPLNGLNPYGGRVGSDLVNLNQKAGETMVDIAKNWNTDKYSLGLQPDQVNGSNPLNNFKQVSDK